MAKCFVKGRVPRRECYGAITEHHVIPQQRIRRHWRTLNLAYRTGKGPKPWPLNKALKDERNKVDICFGCHLGLLETGNPLAQVRESDLPKNFWIFVEEHNAWSLLPTHVMGFAPDKAPA